MKLFTKEITNQLLANSRLGDKSLAEEKPVCKFFYAAGNWTWYPFSMDEDGYCFGLVVGHSVEYGCFHRSELEEFTGAAGLKIERDLYFTAEIFAKLSAHHKNIFVG